MVGGRIADWFAVGNVVHFLVRGTGGESNDFCTVRAFIPHQQHISIVEGFTIWWQSGRVFVESYAGGGTTKEREYPKWGNAGGDHKTYFKKKIEHYKKEWNL